MKKTEGQESPWARLKREGEKGPDGTIMKDEKNPSSSKKDQLPPKGEGKEKKS